MEARPDIVLFMTDEQRYDWVGYASDGHYETPNLDRLAERGVVFERAYSGCTTCVPARTSLLTGLQYGGLPVEGPTKALAPGRWNVAHALRAAGYETALFGRMHFWPVRADQGFDTMRMCENISPGSGYPAGTQDDFSEWMVAEDRPDWRLVRRREPDGPPLPFIPSGFVPYPDDAAHHPTGWIEAEVRRFLAERSSDQPLFLVVSFPSPHAPYDPPEPYASMFDPADARLPTSGAEANDGLPAEFRALIDGGFMTPVHKVDPADPDALRASLTAIRALIRQIDDAMGSILDLLDLDGSLVFFTSDHGDFGGRRGLLLKQPWIAFDDLARVPLVVAGPGIEPGGRVTDLVSSADFTLTCLDYAQGHAPDLPFPTVSLRPQLEGRGDPATVAERVVYCGFGATWPTVISGTTKMIGAPGDWHMLFDLANDPDETVNRWGDPAWAAEGEKLQQAIVDQLRRPVPVLPLVGQPAAGEPA